MDDATRRKIDAATRAARRLLEDEFESQLQATFDVFLDGTIASQPGPHLSARQMVLREKVVAAIEHKRAAGMSAAASVADYLRDSAFTTLNRFVALKLLEARELVQECVTKGDQSVGYREFCGLAPALALIPDDAGYRLYIESLFDELSTEVKVLFDRRDPASVLWPQRPCFEALLEVLNGAGLRSVWGEDETIGWVYQFFNSSEERKRMREESQAPRNGRELAVRNQFFTPRYVVEFLVDNTLGRAWLEMRADKSALAERCRFLVRSEGEEKPARSRKDPRDLCILDPACGSGHFLLYCFDLLLTIYEEAWADDESPAPTRGTGRTLREEYPDLAALRLAAPVLVLQHNLHGVDIDPRAAQIAALALWLRAQRAWKEAGAPAKHRPRLQRTHIVVAEPMPGDSTMVEDFACQLEPPLLRDLFRRMVTEMRLAGDLGTLIPVSDGIASELARARKQFAARQSELAKGYLPGFEPRQRQGEFDMSGVDDDGFFHEAEARMVEALRRFAETTMGSANVRRRLFAGDAAQGIALIDLLRTKFDVVVMNPPFGAMSLAAKREFENAYPRAKADVYAAFVECGIRLLHQRGLLGAITSRTGFFLSTFQEWREEIVLREAPPIAFADLGLGVMDAALVEAAAYCLERNHTAALKTVFLRTLEELHDKESMLRALVKKPHAASGRQRYEVHASSLAMVPRSPFAYWVSDRLRALFGTLRLVESEGRMARRGPSTSDDARYLRCFWEVEGRIRHGVGEWRPFAKGGTFSPYFADVHLVVHWEPRRSTFFGFFGRPGREIERPESVDSFFRPGLTWPLRTKSDLSVRPLPAGCIFGHKGPALFAKGDDRRDLLTLLAVTNSQVFRSLVGFQLAAAEPTGRGGAARSYEVGVLQRTPLPTTTESDDIELADLASRAWSIRRTLDSSTETSHAFLLPALLRAQGEGLSDRVASWFEHVESAEAALADIQARIDERCFALYGVDEADRAAIVASFLTPNVSSAAEQEEDEGEDAHEESGENPSAADASGLAAELVAWAVGVAFGRFDVRRVTGGESSPAATQPFEPFAAWAPGVLIGPDQSPLLRPPSGYPLAFSDSGCLVDDAGHVHDLVAAVRAVFDTVFGSTADQWYSEVTACLSPGADDLREWLGRQLFAMHLQRYSRSRRKAPIFWQLATPSARYSVWLYAHRVGRDIFIQLQNDFIGPKLAFEERQLGSARENAGANPTVADRKRIAAQESLVEELRAMLGEIRRVAPLWDPDLEDGVVLTMAPLWRLVPQHTAWQKELKTKWDELCARRYDWSHIAMHLWPEEVVPKCATDRSLAIAHGLEDEFWVEGANRKWKPRANPRTPIAELIDERSSPAVKAALKSLLEAPARTSKPSSRSRGSR